MKVDGANVLLTGASSGIGAALAPKLAEAGARLALVARREDRLLEVLERCQPHSPGSQIWVCDLDDPSAAEACALEVEGAFGAVDVLVNNAAIPKRRRVTDLSVTEFQQTMRVNLESMHFELSELKSTKTDSAVLSGFLSELAARVGGGGSGGGAAPAKNGPRG